MRLPQTTACASATTSKARSSAFYHNDAQQGCGIVVWEKWETCSANFTRPKKARENVRSFRVSFSHYFSHIFFFSLVLFWERGGYRVRRRLSVCLTSYRKTRAMPTFSRRATLHLALAEHSLRHVSHLFSLSLSFVVAPLITRVPQPRDICLLL